MVHKTLGDEVERIIAVKAIAWILAAHAAASPFLALLKIDASFRGLALHH